MAGLPSVQTISNRRSLIRQPSAVRTRWSSYRPAMMKLSPPGAPALTCWACS